VKRKRVVLILLILVALVLGYLSYYLSYASWLAGFIAAKYGGSKREGKPGRVKSVVIYWHKYRLHLHHWVLAFVTSLVCALKGIYVITPELFYGFLGGLIFQGIYCYNDWHRIISLKARLNPDSDG
jgi:hypothetical protein